MPLDMRPGATTREAVRFYLVDCTTTAGKLIDIGLVGLNAAAVGIYAASTYVDASSRLGHALFAAEWFCVAVFIVEYVLRLWVADRKLQHVFGFYALIDLVSILPAFSTVFNLSFLRVARILRIFRFLRFLEDERFFFGVVTATHLRIARLAFTTVTIIFVSAGCIYEAEQAMSPPEIREIHTLGDAVYFSIVTITTVGFGDMVPKSGLGRAVTLVMIVAGVVTIPYHLGQIARGVFFETRRRRIVCPECGLADHEEDARCCRRCGAALPEPSETENSASD